MALLNSVVGSRVSCRRLCVGRVASRPYRLPFYHREAQRSSPFYVRATVVPAAAPDDASAARSNSILSSISTSTEATTGTGEAGTAVDQEVVDLALGASMNTSAETGASETEAKSEEYSEDMQQKMGTTLTYRHELGINYNRILPDLIVGSCPQTPEDVDLLAETENVRTIFCLQEDPDMAYFKLDIKAIKDRCEERGDIKHVRFPIRDFDPFDLRRKLPKAVTRLAREHKPQNGSIYIHCTAGLGRAPATALAYMFWLRGYQLDAAYELLREKRMCSPRIEAIRSATVDLLVGTEPVLATIAVSRIGTARDIKVAGLDVGWHQQLPLEREAGTGRMVLRRLLQPGKYAYKFIIDGNWTYSADHPTLQDGNNINNYIEVMGRKLPQHLALAQERLLTAGSDLTTDERDVLRTLLCPWATHDAAAEQGGNADAAADAAPPQLQWSDKLP